MTSIALNLSDIPDLDIAPSDARRSGAARAIRKANMNRRSVMKGILGTGMVLGVASLDLLPRWNSASAGPPPWPTWDHCNDYNTWPVDWRKCNPDDADVSTDYCSQGYHRRDSVRIDSCRIRDYRRNDRCYGDDMTLKNAWVWKQNNVDPEPPDVRCSDGKTFVLDECRFTESSWKSTCKKFL